MARVGRNEGEVSVEFGGRGRPALVTLHGELDLANVDVLEQAVLPLLPRDDVPALVFDMAGLTFMDSSALAVLLRAASSGTAVRLRNPSPLIRQLVTATGLDDVLRLEA